MSVPVQHFNDLQDRLENDFRNVLHGYPAWYADPVRGAIDECLATARKAIADHMAAKAQG